MALSKTDSMKNKILGADAAAVDTARSAEQSHQLTHVAPTPGTWCVRWDKGRCNALIDSESRAETDSYVAMVFGPCDSWPTEANAHLIAAAPDLLDALKAIVEYDPNHGPSHHGTKENYEWYGRSPQVWKNAEAAIKKAEGR